MRPCGRLLGTLWAGFVDACVASASRGASRHGLATRSAGSFGAGEVVKTCQCWTDFRPAFNALKAAAADPASAVAAQLASVADVDSQMQGMCGNPKATAFLSCMSAGSAAVAAGPSAGMPMTDFAQPCKCWSDFASAYATLSASKDPEDLKVVASVAPAIQGLAGPCSNAKLVTFMSCIASKAGGKPDMVQGCKCWSDFSSTYATLVASKSPLDISALAFLKESQMIPEIQKSCPASAMASTNTNANNGVTMQPGFLLVAPAVFFLVVFTTR